MEVDKSFYVYVYYKTDGTPYYVGKGTGNRSLCGHGKVPVPLEKNRISYYKDLTENEAFTLERHLCLGYGRLNNHTGTLMNLNDGGYGGRVRGSTNILKKYVIEDYLEGYGIKELSRKYSLGIGTVYSFIDNVDDSNRIPKIKKPGKFEGQPWGRRSNLNEEIRKLTIEDYLNKIPIKKIAKNYSIGVGTVYKIIEEEGLKR
jgi:transposase